jgi:divalent metal cation (Fe/Co/Zn/Cd) transporter
VRVESGSPTGRSESALRRRGRRLEYLTIAWNVVEVFVAVGLGVAAGSLALVAFGLDSLVEVFASVVVVWHIAEREPPVRAIATVQARRTRRALRLVALAFAGLAAYLLVSSGRGLWVHQHADPSPIGIAYLAVTAAVMFSLARLKRSTGQAVASEPLVAEASVTFLDGCLATGILIALALNAALGWWWADPLAAATIGLAAVREARGHWTEAARGRPPAASPFPCPSPGDPR